jgi:farnesyl diphosphate synthase
MMPENEQFSTLVTDVKADIDQFLVEQISALPQHPTRLAEAMQYALIGGGKRMRPLLCFLVAEALDIDKKQTLIIAAAIECIHAYSLIHDDLPAMDDDDTRRGRPTCHIKFGEDTAILAGDALQSMAFYLLSNEELFDAPATIKLKLVNDLAKASGFQGMCGGQAIDLAATGLNSSVPHTLDTLKLLHRLKTGALLKACVVMILRLKENLSESHNAEFVRFADAIGLAFQVQDDILDEVGSDAQIGKPQGSDAEQNKHTFPALLGLDGAKAELQNLSAQALQALESLPYNTQSLAAFCELLIQRDH